MPAPNLKTLIDNTYNERIPICRECPHNSKNKSTKSPIEHCTLCGCPLSAKLKALTSECPDNPKRWDAIITSDELEKLKQDEG